MASVRDVLSQEMPLLANALEMCALDTTYYVPLEALNDTSDPAAIPAYDYIDNDGGTNVIKPSEGKFSPSRVRLTHAYFPWRGPYLTFQRGRTLATGEPYDQGSPLDPWGQPYYFFSPLGLLRGDSGSVTLELYGDQFDRYTIVSLGLDSVKSADDLVYSFGSGVSTTAISSLRGPHVVGVSPGPLARRDSGSSETPDYVVASGSPLTIRGVNLFNDAGLAEVFWGSTRLRDVVTTNPREITVVIPPVLEGTNELVVVAPGKATTNSVRLQITAPTSQGELWYLYE
ncbi:MAG: IPT/TIG domain-containing protein [Candidatus Sumerlaeaceae bacterium]|nr:IPT/TIG domain-containing protein [Candidatus Sumerlaeaceae bacterium]